METREAKKQQLTRNHQLKGWVFSFLSFLLSHLRINTLNRKGAEYEGMFALCISL